MPETPTSGGGIQSLIKRVPTWGWLVLGGAGIGIGYSLWRDRNATPVDDTATVVDPLATDAYAYDALATPQPIPGVPPVTPVIPETETVGAIGQTALAELGTVFGDVLTGVISTLPTLGEYADLIDALPQATAAPPPAPAPVAPPPPPPAPAPPAPTGLTTAQQVENLILSGAWRRGGVAGFLPPGAVGSQINLGSGTNSQGHYVTHRFLYADGSTRRYNHYTSGNKRGQWVGPFGS